MPRLKHFNKQTNEWEYISTNGKSAYAYAQEAGYTGTEADFAAKLASDDTYTHISYVAQPEAPSDKSILWIDTDDTESSDDGSLPNLNEVILNSSTEGSTKKFKITVDDAGTITVSEVV